MHSATLTRRIAPRQPTKLAGFSCRWQLCYHPLVTGDEQPLLADVINGSVDWGHPALSDWMEQWSYPEHTQPARYIHWHQARLDRKPHPRRLPRTNDSINVWLKAIEMRWNLLNRRDPNRELLQTSEAFLAVCTTLRLDIPRHVHQHLSETHIPKPIRLAAVEARKRRVKNKRLELKQQRKIEQQQTAAYNAWYAARKRELQRQYAEQFEIAQRKEGWQYVRNVMTLTSPCCGQPSGELRYRTNNAGQTEYICFCYCGKSHIKLDQAVFFQLMGSDNSKRPKSADQNATTPVPSAV